MRDRNAVNPHDDDTHHYDRSAVNLGPTDHVDDDSPAHLSPRAHLRAEYDTIDDDPASDHDDAIPHRPRRRVR